MSRTTPGQLDPEILLRALCVHRHFVSFFNELQEAGDHYAMPAVQYFGTKGFFADYNARIDDPLTEAVRDVWHDGFKQLQQDELNPMRFAQAVHAATVKESPSTGETRGKSLLRLWQQL